MNKYPFPLPTGEYQALATTVIPYDKLVSILGEPHFYEEDELRTAGGHEAYWAWEREGVIVFFGYAISYGRGGYGICDPNTNRKIVEEIVSELTSSDHFDVIEPCSW